jgi:hypothetical protein
MRNLLPIPSRSGALATIAAAVLLLGACASGDIGDILGGPSGRAPRQVKGIVRTVDTRSGDCRIDLDNATLPADYIANGGSTGGYGSGGRASVYCDSQTRVVFQGQTFRPESLEAGDEIVASVSDVGGRLVAERVDVTYDVSSGGRAGNAPYGNYPQDDRYGSYGRTGSEDVRATVRSVDRSDHALRLERVEYYDRSLERNGTDLTIHFDDRTRVTYRGQSYRPEDLDPGDVIAVSLEQVRGTLVANDIQVLSNGRDGSASYPR